MEWGLLFSDDETSDRFVFFCIPRIPCLEHNLFNNIITVIEIECSYPLVGNTLHMMQKMCEILFD
jgi:hypothetical protein